MAYVPQGIIGDGYYPFYTLKSTNSVHLEEGIYLNIQMHLMPILIAYSSMPIFRDGSTAAGPMNEVDIDSDKEYSIVVTIYCGDTELAERVISFKNNKIQTNWSSPVGTVEDDGYFIRINSSIDGILSLRLNRVVSYDKDGNLSTGQVGFAIVDNITVSRCYPTSMSASDRNENTYYKDILMSGFENKKSIDLTIGTFNNNRPSVAFICEEDDANTNIQELAYNEEGQTEVYDERPEMHLLDRMESIYGSVRRTFKAIVATGNDIFKKRYANSGRNYVGIDAQHNWRDETQEVKFIEVT